MRFHFQILAVVLLYFNLGYTQEARRTPAILHLLSNTSQGKCLDGTPGAFYLRSKNDTSRWMIYFEGGGWCVSPTDCYSRSLSPLGSSSSYPPTMEPDWLAGMLSDNCTVNPQFCDFNFVYLKYCDGNSFAGARVEPLKVGDHKLWFRGRYIREDVLSVLVRDHHLLDAKEILLTGCSAGGLATFLHADAVREWSEVTLPKLVKFRAVPISGFFLDHTDAAYGETYRTGMQEIFNISHARNGGVSRHCLASLPYEEQWRCNYAEYTLARSQTRIFALNSRTDMWQVPCILGSEVPNTCNSLPEFSHCGNSSWPFEIHSCITSKIAPAILSYSRNMADRLQEVTGALAPNNGYFISACWTHCEAISGDNYWTGIEVNGVPMNVAVRRWYNDETCSHRYMDCQWSKTAPYLCNPTCPVVP